MSYHSNATHRAERRASTNLRLARRAAANGRREATRETYGR